MNADRLLAQYDRIADSPDAVGRLRRLILKLALCGKLVPHDPNDDPASKFLTRIAADRAKLATTGGEREAKRVVRIDRNALSFQPPPHWCWARLIDVAHPSYGFAFHSGQFNKTKRGMPLIRIRDISDTDTEVHFDGDYDPSYLVTSGDYLVGMDGHFNLRQWRGKDGLLNQRVMRINGWRYHINPEFAVLPLQSILNHLHGETSKTTVKHLSAKQVNGIELPLPPLGEQHRIVAKIAELMAMCDRLEVARAERETVRDRFAAATLARFTEPKPSALSAGIDFAVNNFGPLTTRPNQVRILRQAILNLAVRGKLVTQDANDESAVCLLRRLADGKAERKRNTRDSRIVVQPSPKPDELPIPLPNGWSVQSFANLFLFIDYRGKTPPKTDAGIPLITAKNIRMGHLNREPREYISVKTFETWMTRGFPQAGDLFFTTEAPLANVCLNDISEPFALAQRAICFQPYAEIDTKFFMFALMSEPMQALIGAHATGLTAKGIKAAKLKPLPIPVPPLAEQHRIVAKVEELMALTDRLERRLAEEAALRSRLFGALLNEATVAA